MTGTIELVEAVKLSDNKRVEELLRQDPALARARDESGVSAILLARYRGATEIVDELRPAAGDLDVFEAAALGDGDRLARLLDEDAGLASAWSSDGFTPLHLAAFFGQSHTAELLVDRGANVAAVSRNRLAVMPLHSAAAGGHTQIARLLVACGADVNAMQEGGFAPLHGAAQNGDRALVELLLDAGADATRATEDGRRPVDMAREHGHDDVAALLEAS